MTATVHNIDDHRAFTCDCGSVNFALLRSDGIECNACGKVHPFEWRELDASECPNCGGNGRVERDGRVDNSGYTLPVWEACDVCHAFGYVGPDAEKMWKAGALQRAKDQSK